MGGVWRPRAGVFASIELTVERVGSDEIDWRQRLVSGYAKDFGLLSKFASVVVLISPVIAQYLPAEDCTDVQYNM